jgi:hypothetical protein
MERFKSGMSLHTRLMLNFFSSKISKTHKGLRQSHDNQIGTKSYLCPFAVHIYVMQSRRFSQSPAFLSRTAKERDKKCIVKSP